MTTDFLDWLEQQPDIAPRGGEGWMCDTIEKAEYAARRLRQAADKIADINRVADRIIADANAWRREATERYAVTLEGEKKNLQTFLQVQIAEGGAKSAPLPWGVMVKARRVGGTLDLSNLDADKAPADIVKMKPSIVAAEAKKYFRIVGPDGVAVDGKKAKAEPGVAYTVIDPNGEVVDGVTVSPVEDKFEVVV